MKEQEIKSVLSSYGWKEDRWGHMQKEITVIMDDETPRKQQLRVKFQAISVRFERKIDGGWFMKSNAYMRDVKLDETGLIIGRLRIKRPTK